MFLSTFLRYFLPAISLVCGVYSTLFNPDMVQQNECYARTSTPSLIANDCAEATLGFPDSRMDVDYHFGRFDASGHQIVYVSALTSIGDPTSRYYLPKTFTHGDCLIRVTMQEGVHFARLLWFDVRLSALSLIQQCVGDLRTSNPEADGVGGRTSVGAVWISVEHVNAVPKTKARPFTIALKTSSNPNLAAMDFELGAYYPSEETN